MIPILFVAGVLSGTLGIGIWGIRFARTTSDLYVASRSVTPWWNAAAVSGEYLSAASFLGVAGLMMKIGAPALWQPVGFTAGYLALLLFVAAPLRRYGAYTISDFAEARLESPSMRLAASAIVLGIGGLYLVPQLKGAGISVEAVTGAPYWVGVLAIAAIVSLSVGFGGMRGITYVQAYQFWVKVFAIAAPAAVLLAIVGLPNRSVLFGHSYPTAPKRGVVIKLHSPQAVEFPAAATYVDNGRRLHARAGAKLTLPAGTLRLLPGQVVPVAKGTTPMRGAIWSRPIAGGGSSSPLFVYSLLIATVLGTMGLPHILVRFYTNPDGPTARRTTVNVLGLLGLFYTFPAVYGLLGRALAPGLYTTGSTDSVVLELPHLAWPGVGGRILAGLTAAGAFAAFISTSSGLLVSLSGTIAYDIWPGIRRTESRGRTARRRTFRAAVPIAVVVPAGLALHRRGHRDQRPRRLGVRSRGEHVLPTVLARHLVDRPDGARSGARDRGRRLAHDRGDRRRPGRRARRRCVRRIAVATGARRSSRRVRDDARRLAAARRPPHRCRETHARAARTGGPRARCLPRAHRAAGRAGGLRGSSPGMAECGRDAGGQCDRGDRASSSATATSSRSTASTSTWPAGRSAGCSGRTAPARRQPFAC